jgi:hypothetical protein
MLRQQAGELRSGFDRASAHRDMLEFGFFHLLYARHLLV